MIELWKDVKNYEGVYCISNLGRIKRILNSSKTNTDRILKPQINRFGYLQITLCKNGHKKTLKLHRLVLESFVGDCLDGMECCHKDRNRQNNQLTNLRWGTKSENAQDAIQHNTFSRLHACGEKNRMSKLTDDKIKLVLQLLQSGKNGHPGRKLSQKEIAAIFGVDQSTISYISTRKIWKHVQRHITEENGEEQWTYLNIKTEQEAQLSIWT
ncbi:hypothetical protein LCGC14_0140890 [marine sediment metagenome]|uniref:HNH nuclease domain-containing protein n=1 Tax=marine sediment metagenome TaxID=412755 RepID=A0A0F9Y2G9_9ZZZZ